MRAINNNLCFYDNDAYCLSWTSTTYNYKQIQIHSSQQSFHEQEKRKKNFHDNEKIVFFTE